MRIRYLSIETNNKALIQKTSQYLDMTHIIATLSCHPTTFLKTQHVYSTLKQHGNDRFQVVSMWNTSGVFPGFELQAIVLIIAFLSYFPAPLS